MKKFATFIQLNYSVTRKSSAVKASTSVERAVSDLIERQQQFDYRVLMCSDDNMVILLDSSNVPDGLRCCIESLRTEGWAVACW